MKNQVWVKYKVSNTFLITCRAQVHVKLYQKTLAPLAKWATDTNVSDDITCSMATEVFSMRFKSINIVLEVGEYNS